MVEPAIAGPSAGICGAQIIVTGRNSSTAGAALFRGWKRFPGERVIGGTLILPTISPPVIADHER
jgi:hypothetical protein